MHRQTIEMYINKIWKCVCVQYYTKGIACKYLNHKKTIKCIKQKKVLAKVYMLVCDYIHLQTNKRHFISLALN